MDILCPVCLKKLHPVDKAYKCENGHSFDLAKEGYLNLNRKSSQNTGDNPEMIKARKRFLEKGYYDFMKKEVNKLLKPEDALIDLACGEGYYTKDFVCKDKVGIDLSKSGLKIASKSDKSTTYLLNSIFHNPLSDKCADKIVTIFAPIAEEEILRLLKDDGSFILVRPDERHLYELKNAIYASAYLNEAKDVFVKGMKRVRQIPVSQKATVPHDVYSKRRSDQSPFPLTVFCTRPTALAASSSGIKRTAAIINLLSVPSIAKALPDSNKA